MHEAGWIRGMSDDSKFHWSRSMNKDAAIMLSIVALVFGVVIIAVGLVFGIGWANSITSNDARDVTLAKMAVCRSINVNQREACIETVTPTDPYVVKLAKECWNANDFYHCMRELKAK